MALQSTNPNGRRAVGNDQHCVVQNCSEGRVALGLHNTVDTGDADVAFAVGIDGRFNHFGRLTEIHCMHADAKDVRPIFFRQGLFASA